MPYDFQGPQTRGFPSGSHGGWGDRLAMRGYLAGHYHPNLPRPTSSYPYCDSLIPMREISPQGGPSTSLNQDHQQSNWSDPFRFTHYDNPTWGDPSSDIEIFPEMENRAYNEHYGRTRSQNPSRHATHLQTAPTTNNNSDPPPTQCCRGCVPSEIPPSNHQPNCMMELHVKMSMKKRPCLKPTWMKMIFLLMNCMDWGTSQEIL